MPTFHFKKLSNLLSVYSVYASPHILLLLIMQLYKISMRDTHSFPHFFLDYISHNDSLKNFYYRFPVIESFDGQIQKKNLSRSKIKMF